tara:strand:+ start:67 stop:669 length:603 start_codon:yes stop_codon:yes gene_type:complete
MPVLPLLALVPIVVNIGGRVFVQMVAKNAVKSLVKKGFKKLTKKNFKKSYEFFQGDKPLKLADKNKVLKNLKINIPKPKIDSKAAAEGAKIVKDVTKQTKTGKAIEQTRKILFPGMQKRSLIQYPAYYYGTKKAFEKHEAIKEAEEKSLREEKKQTEIKAKKQEHEKKKEGTTLKEIDLNILADKEHTWKTNAQGDYITE